MNVATITMSREDAAKKLEAYRSALDRGAGDDTEEFEAAVMGYHALAHGTPLLDLLQVIRDAPCDDIGRPRLAIARADRLQVRLLWPSSGERCHFVTNAELSQYRMGAFPGLVRSFDMSREHNYRTIKRWDRAQGLTASDLSGYALVPMVPPNVLRNRSQLRHHWVLWEVEEWSNSRLTPQPDRDPYLLKHLGGTLYAVLGEWDLTDLERAIMRGRSDG